MNSDNLNFDQDGAVLYRAVLSFEAIEALRDTFDPVLKGRPGKRLMGGNWSELLQTTGIVGRIAADLIGEAAKPVRAIVFDKTPETNWSVAWHQDRTIAVKERMDVEGFGPWSTKDGITHVEPPVGVLEGMITLRLHLDDCDEHNAPLKVALGSHRLGYVAANQAAIKAMLCPTEVCLAKVGDVWAYKTLILHASERSNIVGRRRVLQVDYAAIDLPNGLDWRTIE